MSPLNFSIIAIDDPSNIALRRDAIVSAPIEMNDTQHSHARTGLILVGEDKFIRTPAFMPVGTYGSVRGLTPDMIKQTCSDVILCNAWHLMVRPGAPTVHAMGGLHKFTGWNGGILTDSGGFQVMSLANARKVDDDGVTFQDHTAGATHRITPEIALEVQTQLGSDIAMQFDHCVDSNATREEVEDASLRSLRWAQRTREAMSKKRKNAVFGIVQGGVYGDLRRQSARGLVEMDFDGYAIGGLAVGEGHDAMIATLAQTTPSLPWNLPRYLMGVGTPWDIISAVSMGVDMFDCVMPSREGRHGNLYTHGGKINIRNAKYANDSTSIDEHANLKLARDTSRGYLHHLFRCNEMLGPVLASAINIAFYQSLMAEIRQAILHGRYHALIEKMRSVWERNTASSIK